MDRVNFSIVSIKRKIDDRSYGFNLFFPKTKIMYIIHSVHRGKPYSRYDELKFLKDTRWDDFLKAYL